MEPESSFMQSQEPSMAPVLSQINSIHNIQTYYLNPPQTNLMNIHIRPNGNYILYPKFFLYPFTFHLVNVFFYPKLTNVQKKIHKVTGCLRLENLFLFCHNYPWRANSSTLGTPLENNFL
jgi:hypothetical protein